MERPRLHGGVGDPGAGLTAKIPSGMRAISVRSDEVVGVAGFLLPGTHVDVLMTLSLRRQRTRSPQTLTALQDVVVLAAGQQIQPQADGKPSSVNVVTLLLKPEDAEKLVLATSLGGIYFVLRNGADEEQALSPPVGLTQLAGASDSIAALQSPNALVRGRFQPTDVHPSAQAIRGGDDSGR